MKRRALLATAATAAASAVTTRAQTSSDAPRPRYYEFRIYSMMQGDQPRRMNEFAGKRLLPLLQKHKFGPAGFFTVLMGQHSPGFIGLLSYNSLAEREELWGKLGRDPEWARAVTDLEGPAEPPFLRADSFLVRAASYAPPLAMSAAEVKPRIFELRIYQSPTERQLVALNERFGGPEVKIFHRVGIHPILYGDTVIGAGMPNLVYLTPFETLAEREKAWAAFAADPEWQKVLPESVQKAGNIVRNISITMLRASAFSPIR